MANDDRKYVRVSSLSVRVRFEVFKRDRFTCSYCGQTPPNVLLEVDHIVPRAAGGSDDTANLTTSCKDCNRGKSAGLLDEGTAPVVSRAATDEMAERIEQARAYMEVLAARDDLIEDQVARVHAAWARAYQATIDEQEDGTYWVLPGYGGHFPEERSIRSILGRLPLGDVLDAVDITAGRFGRPSQDACRYFYGVCWSKIRAGT